MFQKFTVSDLSKAVPADGWERTQNPPLSPLELKTGAFTVLERWHDPLHCSLCGREEYILLNLTRQLSICGVCREIIAESHNAYHGGRFFHWKNPAPKAHATTSRLSEPPSTSQSMAVYRRDDFTCRYCGDGGGDLTVDHIDPSGGNEMDNFATACRSCNSSKGRRTPEEAGMELLSVENV